MQCKVCGAKLHENSNYCHVCGAKLSDEDIEVLKQIHLEDETKTLTEENVNEISGFNKFRNKLHKVLVSTSDINDLEEVEVETESELQVDLDIDTIQSEDVSDSLDSLNSDSASEDVEVEKKSIVDRIKNFINISEPNDEDLDDKSILNDSIDSLDEETEVHNDKDEKNSAWNKFKKAFSTFINEDDEDEFNIFDSSSREDDSSERPVNFTPIFIDSDNTNVDEESVVDIYTNIDEDQTSDTFEVPIDEILELDDSEVLEELKIEMASIDDVTSHKVSIKDKLSKFFKSDEDYIDEVDLEEELSDVELVTDSVSKEFLRKSTKEDSSNTKVYGNNLSDSKPEDVNDETSNLKFVETIKNFFLSIANFFKTIFRNLVDFFKPKEKLSDENYEIPEKSEDTIQITLTDKEKAQLNAGFDDSEETNIFDKMNAVLYPYIKQLLALNSYVRIPLLAFSIFFSTYPIVITFKNSVPIVIVLSIIKFILAFVLANMPLTMAFQITKIKLKRSVISFFVLLSLFVNQFVSFIGFMLYPLSDSQTGNLLNALSPAFIISAISLVIVLLFILSIAYNHIKNSNPLIFTGWFLVIHVTIVLMSKLFFVLLSTILSSLFFNLII